MEAELWQARLRDQLSRVQLSGQPQATRFMDPAQQQLARRLLAQFPDVPAVFEGGYAYAERRVLVLGEREGLWQMPVMALRARWHEKYAHPGHRDMLGALMGLGMTREMLGDIVMLPGQAYLFAVPQAAEVILRDLDSAGRAALRVESVDLDSVEIPEPEGKRCTLLLASLRLDALIQEALGLSRAKAQEAVRAGKVQRNWQEELRVDAPVAQGDVYSVKGFGRIRIEGIAGETRKGRQRVEVFIPQ
ncbi:MAG: RNA-binding protein [Christensenellales bacterium]|jgi:RNA-binding protein YlmH